MRFYSSIHQYYDQIFPLNLKQVEWVNNECDQLSTRILDIGCATGNLAIELAQKGHSVNAFDLDGTMVQLATTKSSSGNPQFRKANMLNIKQNYRTDFFDVSICFGNTLVHLTAEALIQQFFDSVFSVLKTGGKFLIQILNYDFILKNRIAELPLIENNQVKFIRRYYFITNGLIQFETQLTIKEGCETIENKIDLYPITKDHIEDLLLAAGFSNIEFRSSFNDDSYQPTSIPLIIKAVK